MERLISGLTFLTGETDILRTRFQEKIKNISKEIPNFKIDLLTIDMESMISNDYTRLMELIEYLIVSFLPENHCWIIKIPRGTI